MADHILILDDDLGTLALAQRRLSHAGFKVTPCSSIKEARAQLGDEGLGTDLIITDFALSAEAESGLDFLRTLADAGIKLPSILMTGYVTEERILEALRSGVADFVRKSEGYLELLPTVARKALDGYRMQRELLVAEEGRRYYRLLSNAIPHLVYTVAPDGALLFSNQPCTDFTGQSAAQLGGRDWIEALVAPEDQSDTRTAFAEGRRSFSIIHRLAGAAASVRWFATRGTFMLLDGSSAEVCLLTSTDIDQQYRAAQDNSTLLENERLARAAAEAATRAKDEFIATVSHELRSPLNAIVGWTEVMLRDPHSSERARSGLEVILRNAKAQAKMIDDLLDMSSVLAGRLRLEMQPVDLTEIVNLAILTVKPAADDKGISMSQDLAEACPIAADPARLQQVLWNLLMNALKFTEKGGHIAVRLSTQGPDYLISVSDSGRGIAAEFLPHVFERFRQETSVSRPKGGLGLGLAITRELVELHGGQITVTSDGPGTGATFDVRLPIKREQAPARGTPMEAPSDWGALRRTSVLVVEDDPDARNFIVAGLRDQGAQVLAAASVADALSLFFAQRPDIVLSDLGLGEQDGYSLVRAIREYEAAERLPATPAIALSALNRLEDRHRSFAAGFNAHLGKPVDTEELLRVLSSLTGAPPAAPNAAAA